MTTYIIRTEKRDYPISAKSEQDAARKARELGIAAPFVVTKGEK